MNNNRWLQALIILLVIIAASWIAGQVWLLLNQFASIILLFFLAWLVAFSLSPIARWLEAQGLPKVAAVGLVYLALAVVLVLIGWGLFPALAHQTQSLVDASDTYTRQLEDLSVSVEKQLNSWGVRVQDLHLETLYGTMGEQVKNVGGSVLTFVSGLAGVLFNTVIVLLLSFYFMKDGERMFNGAVVVLPRPLGSELQLLGDSIARAFGGFLRGQLVFATLYGILNAIIMGAFNLEYVLIVSIVAGLAMLIPLVGNLLAYFPPLLVILVSANIDKWWLLLLVIFVVQTVMMQMISPRILSTAVGMHPLFVVGALLVGLQLAGPWGALFGIPVAGVLQQVVGPYFSRLRGFFNVPSADQPALALQGTMPVAVVGVAAPDVVVPTPVADPGSGPPVPVPVSARLAVPNPRMLLLVLLGLGRRALGARRRSRP